MFSGVRRLADQNPVVMAAWVMGISGIVLPFVVIPVRSALGFKTNQYTKKMKE